MTLVILGGALHYWLAEGYSAWGIQNRLFGWFVLLGYLFCGALLPTVMGEDGRRRATSSYLAAICIICLFEIFRYWFAFADVAFAFEVFPFPGVGFSGNTNAQGLFILAGIALALALPLQRKTALAALVVLFAGIYLTGSRSALATSVIIAIICMLVDSTRIRTTLLATIAAGLVLFTPIALHSISNASSNDEAQGPTNALIFLPSTRAIEPSSDGERLNSIKGGWELWTESPLFGAGIGAHYEQTAANGAPLVIHNVPVWLLAETGAVGLLIFLSVGVLITRSLWQQWISGSQVAGGLLLFFIGATAMSMAHDLLYQRVIWFFLGLALGYVQLAESSDRLIPRDGSNFSKSKDQEKI